MISEAHNFHFEQFASEPFWIRFAYSFVFRAIPFFSWKRILSFFKAGSVECNASLDTRWAPILAKSGGYHLVTSGDCFGESE